MGVAHSQRVVFFGGAQLAADTTLVSPLTEIATPCHRTHIPRAANVDPPCINEGARCAAGGCQPASVRLWERKLPCI